MAVYKCKMCGGNLNVDENVKIAQCDFCGSIQTVPMADDENIQKLFNRANTLRIKCEFDRAIEMYDRILQIDSNNVEAHWCIVLCRYGIEYVEDNNTFSRVPTCHRTLHTSIMSDEDYLAAIENADFQQKNILEKEAKKIEDIQKKILRIPIDESPYDVFISYKDKDENGRKTKDSALANDIYYQLTKEGYKVFYSAISLADKLGMEYEPYIYAALNTSKVMLVIGTKQEYFSSVWVKNEWSRYLKLMESDKTKVLIPCYKDIEPYELPEEFSCLQAQDMSKIGFISDIIYGMKRIFGKTERKSSAEDEKAGENINALLKRTYMALEEGDWDSADELCEKILNMNAEMTWAYIAKLMAELHVSRYADLVKYKNNFSNSNNYRKAMQFADDKLKAELSGFTTNKVDSREEKEYKRIVNKYESATELNDYIECLNDFKKLKKYRDSKVYVEKCKNSINEFINNIIIQRAKRRCDEAISECEVYKIEKMFEEYRDFSEINTAISNVRTKFAGGAENAQKIWTEYMDIKNEWNKFEDIRNKISNANFEIKKIEAVLSKSKETFRKNEILKVNMIKVQNSIETLQVENIQIHEQLEKIGVFAFRRKKELETSIGIVDKSLFAKKSEEEKILSEISQNEKDILDNDSEMMKLNEINELKNSISILEEEKNKYLSRFTSLKQNIDNETVLAELLGSDDNDIYSGILKDLYLIPRIKASNKLMCITRSNSFFFHQSRDVRQQLLNEEELHDLECGY